MYFVLNDDFIIVAVLPDNKNIDFFKDQGYYIKTTEEINSILNEYYYSLEED